MFRLTGFVVVLFLMLSGCAEDDLGQAPLADDYPQEVYEWMDRRVETLKEPTGWLRLAGMYWLNEGENVFGSGEQADVRFPEGTIPDRAGVMIYENGTVLLRADEGVTITHEGEPVEEMVIYDGDETPAVQYEDLEFHVIEREELTGIRLYNKDNQQADNFDGFPRYDIDEKWHREARFIPNPEGTTIPVANVLGQLVDTPSPGYIEFTLEGEQYTLDALEATDQMFLIVGDLTNQTESYQAGRYIYIDYPEEGSDYTVIDFNKIYNPPCSYNSFTTCQLPPSQNRLDVAIEAGEKRPVEWSGL